MNTTTGSVLAAASTTRTTRQRRTAMQRGPVEIKGVTTRTNENPDRTCVACLHHIGVGRRYERVARLNGDIESYHPQCFEDEFGSREAYGD